jgi:hypothetical protein
LHFFKKMYLQLNLDNFIFSPHIYLKIAIQSSKFIKLLRSLNQKEVSDFQKYLNLVHRNENVALAIFHYIRKFYPGFKDEKRLDIDYAYAKIFPVDKAVDLKKIPNALPDLTKWLKNYLVLEQVSGRSFEALYFLVRTLRAHDLDAESNKVAAELKDMVANTVKSGVSDYMNSMVANHLFYFYLHHNKEKSNGDLLQQCNDDMDIAYAISKFKLACEIIGFNKKFTPEQPVSVLPLPFELLEKHAASSFLLQLYASLYQLIITKDDNHYEVVESVLLEHGHVLERNELHTILIHIRSYSAHKIRGGDDDVTWQRAHNLNKISLQSGFFKRKK